MDSVVLGKRVGKKWLVRSGLFADTRGSKRMFAIQGGARWLAKLVYKSNSSLCFIGDIYLFVY